MTSEMHTIDEGEKEEPARSVFFSTKKTKQKNTTKKRARRLNQIRSQLRIVFYWIYSIY